MTATASELTRILLDVLRGLPGLRAATPSTRPETSWLPWDLDMLAVDVDDELVEIRLVALSLPLPPLLRTAETALRSVLDDSAWRNARLRLVITDLDAAAFTARPSALPEQGDGGHPIGS